MKIFIIYSVIAIATEVIVLLRGYEVLTGNPNFKTIKQMLLPGVEAKLFKEFITNPYVIIFVGIPMLVIVSPLVFPYTVYSWLRELIFGKSTAEKAAEANERAMESAIADAKRDMEKEKDFYGAPPESLNDETINMKVSGLDADTQAIIDAMCSHTGKTKEQAILALVEFGMLSMIAATHKAEDRLTVMNKIFYTVNKDARLLATAQAYAGYWSI